ncbi:MAG TPA: SRPBCC family protein [Solirubrobacteraceae bacterium]|nr:SRPBCC family protein [Solirubrobacteraceae bacterium]
MPTARRSRTIAAPVSELWGLICDPHHLPRWWPRVERVEDVVDDAFTELMRTSKGKAVRADFRLVRAEEQTHSLAWEQQLEGTPFARVLSSAETLVTLQPAGEQTSVTIELRQKLGGFFPRFGGFMVRRAAGATLDEALDGLERISG